MTKIAFKYGLLITAVLIAWILLSALVWVLARSRAQILSRRFFSMLPLLSRSFLGMNARKRELNGSLGFKEGVKTGMAIALVYAVSACLFFMIEYLVAGPELMMSEANPQNRPAWQLAVFAYAGLFFGSLFFGLIYSTVIASILAKRRGEEPSEII